MYVAGQMGHADWSMLVKVYGRWIPSGAITQAGELVATANAENWVALFNLMGERIDVVPQLADYEGDGELDDVELGGRGRGRARCSGLRFGYCRCQMRALHFGWRPFLWWG